MVGLGLLKEKKYNIREDLAYEEHGRENVSFI